MADIPPSRTASANCASCHSSSYYERVTLTSATAPPSIEVGAQGQVDVLVDVEGSDKRSSYTGFSITVSLSQQNNKLTLPASQSLSGQTLSGTSAPYRWSRTFSFMVTGKAGGDEVITASARMDPNHGSPAVTDSKTALTTVTVTNHPPGLSQQQLTPSSGDTNTGFSYSVLYTDPDGDIPSFIRLLIDGSVKGDLLTISGQGMDHITGVRYGITGIKLPVGTHNYGFVASDGSVQVDLPIGGSFEGPTVIRANTPPVLSNGTVTPGSGSPGDEFIFYVDYLDLENDIPSSGVLISISGGPYTAMSVDMSAPATKKDGAFNNGERFMYRRTLAEGTYLFSFNVSDGMAHNSLGPLTGPVVSVVPTLVASIEAPKAGSVFRDGEGIWLNGSFSSNRALSDVVFTWSSNISSDLGNGNSILVVLPTGHHRVKLSVSSDSLSLSSEDTVDIEVRHAAPVITLGSYYPTRGVLIEEGSEQVFIVRASSVPTGTIGYYWELDLSKVDNGLPQWTYAPGYGSAGSHEVRCTMTMDDAVPLTRSWSVLVQDRPAPIDFNGNLTTDLGEYAYGDIFGVTINASDPLGRTLSVHWSIDGVAMASSTGLDLSMVLRDGQWASLGDHIIVAAIRNPDGTEMEVRFTYHVLGPDPFGPEGRGPPGPLLAEGTVGATSAGPILGSFDTNWPGYLIVAVCTIAAVVKLVSAVLVLTKKDDTRPPGGPTGRSVGPGNRKEAEGFERWD